MRAGHRSFRSDGASLANARPSGQDLSFPGGGQILFVPSQAPGYPWEGIGIVEADGSIRRFPSDQFTFPYWDPADSDRLLTLSYNEARPEARSFEIVGDALRLVGSWRTSELWAFPSPDGKTLAYIGEFSEISQGEPLLGEPGPIESSASAIETRRQGREHDR